MSDEELSNVAGVPVQRPSLASVAEWTIGKIVARYVVPALLALGAFLGPRYIDSIVSAIEARVDLVEKHIGVVEKDADEKISLVRQEVASGRERNITVQSELSKTLVEVQKTLAAQQATSQAQYEMLQRHDASDERRFERLEDRVGGPR